MKLGFEGQKVVVVTGLTYMYTPVHVYTLKKKKTQDIDKKIKDKEHHRVTKSMPLSEEKKLLREIDLLKKQKVALKAYLAKDEALQVHLP